MSLLFMGGSLELLNKITGEKLYIFLSISIVLHSLILYCRNSLHKNHQKIIEQGFLKTLTASHYMFQYNLRAIERSSDHSILPFNYLCQSQLYIHTQIITSCQLVQPSKTLTMGKIPRWRGKRCH